jgi:hypothetical protein
MIFSWCYLVEWVLQAAHSFAFQAETERFSFFVRFRGIKVGLVKRDARMVEKARRYGLAVRLAQVQVNINGQSKACRVVFTQPFPILVATKRAKHASRAAAGW